MIPINRDTMMLVATVVCVAGLLFPVQGGEQDEAGS